MLGANNAPSARVEVESIFALEPMPDHDRWRDIRCMNDLVRGVSRRRSRETYARIKRVRDAIRDRRAWSSRQRGVECLQLSP